jgi:hypothetical protein
MPDEHPSGIRIAGQQPPIPVGTAVNLSRPNGHGGICSLFPQPYSSGECSATPAGQGPQIQSGRGVLLVARAAGPGLRELIALSLLAGLGCGVALAHGDLIFVAVFAGAIAMTRLTRRCDVYGETSAGTEPAASHCVGQLVILRGVAMFQMLGVFAEFEWTIIANESIRTARCEYRMIENG